MLVFELNVFVVSLVTLECVYAKMHGNVAFTLVKRVPILRIVIYGGGTLGSPYSEQLPNQASGGQLLGEMGGLSKGCSGFRFR